MFLYRSHSPLERQPPQAALPTITCETSPIDGRSRGRGGAAATDRRTAGVRQMGKTRRACGPLRICPHSAASDAWRCGEAFPPTGVTVPGACPTRAARSSISDSSGARSWSSGAPLIARFASFAFAARPNRDTASASPVLANAAFPLVHR